MSTAVAEPEVATLEDELDRAFETADRALARMSDHLAVEYIEGDPAQPVMHFDASSVREAINQATADIRTILATP